MSFSWNSQHNKLGQGTLPIILITLEGLILACQCSFLDTCWLVHCMKWINLSYKKEANKKTYHRNGDSPDAPLVTLAVTQCHIRSLLHKSTDLHSPSMALLTLREVLVKSHYILKEVSNVGVKWQVNKDTTNKFWMQDWCCNCMEQEWGSI